MKNKADLLLNPVRMRIIQFTAQNQPVTVAQTAKALPDVPKATLYRHMRVLTSSGILSIVSEEKIRGTFEQSYSLNTEKIYASGNESGSELHTLVYSVLTKLIADFTEYFGNESENPYKDRLFVSSNALRLDDNDYNEFIREIFETAEKYSRFPVKVNAKTRAVTFISSPAPEEREDDNNA